MNLDRLQDAHCSGLSPTSCDGLTVIFANCFEPDWHPYYGRRLAVFPRSLSLHDSRQDASISCWPDLATLTEDDAARQIAYYPSEYSSRSFRLVFEKRAARLDVWVYEDDRILLQYSVSNVADNALRAEELL
jgi:hypothetical protein